MGKSDFGSDGLLRATLKCLMETLIFNSNSDSVRNVMSKYGTTWIFRPPLGLGVSIKHGRLNRIQS